jgi:hypothetical protein
MLFGLFLLLAAEPLNLKDGDRVVLLGNLNRTRTALRLVGDGA